MLVLSVTKYLDELLQDGSLTTIAALRKLCRVVVMAVDFAFVFVVAILSTKNCWANGAGEVFDVVFALEGGDVRSAKCTTTLEAKKVKSSEIVGFTKRELPRAVLCVHREELGSHDLTTVCTLETVEVKGPTKGPYELSRQALSAFLACP